MASHDLVSIGLANPKSPSNVAAILRAAGCYGASSVFYTGQRFRHAKDFNQDTKGVRHQIPCVGVDDLFDFAAKGAVSVAVELATDAIPLPEFHHPDNAFYILGPEDGSLDAGLVKKCEHVVYVPTFSSMNLAATANVVLYDRLSKRNYPHSNEFIHRARDINNNL